MRADNESPRVSTAHAGELGVGVIGAGMFARGILLPQLAKLSGAKLVGICTTRGTTARDAARRFRCAMATTDPARLFGDEGVDVVVIATRHSSHAALAATALRAGKHVFVEKPLCLGVGELDELERALDDARQAGHSPCLMVGFNRRFSPHAQALFSEFATRTGPMVVNYRVSAGIAPAGSWVSDPAEGGRIVGEACHFVDFCGVLVGSAPVAVTAHGTEPNGCDPTTQSVALTIRYDDGSLANIQYVTAGSPRLPKERCEVFTDERTAVLDDFRITRIHGGGQTVRGRQAKGFGGELRAFLDACRGGDWPIPWESMATTHHICFGAVQSLRAGRTVQLANSLS